MLAVIWILISGIGLFLNLILPTGFPCVAQLVKNLPAMQEIWLRSLGQEDPLEKGLATYSSILASPAPKKGLKEILYLQSYLNWFE